MSRRSSFQSNTTAVSREIDSFYDELRRIAANLQAILNVDAIAGDITAIVPYLTDIDALGNVATDIGELNSVRTELVAIHTSLTNLLTLEATVVPNIDELLLVNDNAALVQTLYDEFRTRYMGAAAFDPTLDPLGNPLVYGSMYFNTQSNMMRVYGTTGWGDMANITEGSVSTLTNKTLILPKINEDVELTATSTELNQLDNVTVGGVVAGDIVTIDGAQILTNKIFDDPTNFIHADATHYKVKVLEPMTTGDPIMFVGYNSGENAIEIQKYDGTAPAIGICHYPNLTAGLFTTVLISGRLEGKDGNAGDLDTSLWAENTILHPSYTDATETSATTTANYTVHQNIFNSTTNGLYTCLNDSTIGDLLTDTTKFQYIGLYKNNWVDGTPVHGQLDQHAAYVLRSHSSRGVLLVTFQVPENLSFYSYDNVASGLVAQNGQDAIDELQDQKLDRTDGGIVTGNVEFQGSTLFTGPSVQVNGQTVTTSDNLIIINDGEVGTGVTNGIAGLEVDRGLLTNYQFIFNETDDAFRIGEIGNLQAVATREDTPLDGGVALWDAVTNKFITSLDPNVTSITATTGSLTTTNTSTINLGTTDLVLSKDAGHLFKVQNASGYIAMGVPSTYAYIFTDQASIIFGNKIAATTEMRINGSDTFLTAISGFIGGSSIITSATIGSQSVAYATDAGTLDTLDSTQFIRSDVNAVFTGDTLSMKSVAAATKLKMDANSTDLSAYVDFYNDASARVGYIGNASGTMQAYATAGLELIAGGNITANGNRVLTTADEGTLNAGTLDSLDSTQFLRSDTADTMNGDLTIASASATPLIVTRSSDTNINMKFAGSTAAAYLGINATNELLFGTSADLAGTGSKVWHAGNDGAGSTLDADTVDGYQTSQTSVASTVVVRDGVSDVYARLFRSSYAEQATAPASTADICFRNDTTDNYMRFMTGAAFVGWLQNFDGSGSGLDADTVDGLHVGTSGNAIPSLNGVNTWGSAQTISATLTVNNVIPPTDSTGALGTGASSWSSANIDNLTVNQNITVGGTVDGIDISTIPSVYAPLASPALTGTPTAPTPAASDNSTNIATTEFVQGELASAGAVPTTIRVSQTYTNGTASQSISSTGETVVILNTVDENGITGASLSSNSVYLPAGDYIYEADSATQSLASSQLILTKNGSNYNRGPSSVDTLYSGHAPISVSGHFNLASSGYVGLKVDVSGTGSLGATSVLTSNETYVTLTITKVG